MLRENLWVLFVLLFSTSAFAQNSTFEDLPLENQLYQRNVNTNRAVVPINGTISSLGYTRVRLQVSNEQGQIDEQTRTLNYIGGSANFQFSALIPAERNNHTINISALINGDWRVLRNVTGILAGDIYIINGQSNAQAAAAPHENDIDPYTRSWFVPFGWGPLNLSFPGLWGARLAKNISIDQNLPVAIFNQAVGAEPIVSYLPTVINGNYASLTQRFENANVSGDIRAALWFHGEANSWGTPTEEYMEDFRSIQDAWKRDYGIDWTFVFQMRYQSCTSQQPDILEAHRRIGQEFSNTDALSTTNANHDECHFYYEGGYRELGDRMTELVKNRLYAGNNNLAWSHDIQNIRISNTNDRQLILTFDRTTSLKTIGAFPHQDFELLQSNASIVGGRVSGATVILNLSEPIQFTTGLSYLSHKGNAPGWITNQEDVGIFTFANFPISNAPEGSQSCNIDYNINGLQVEVNNLFGEVVALKILNHNDFSVLYACDTWSAPCERNEAIDLAPGEYFLQIKTYSDNGITEVCDIFEEITIESGTTTTTPPSFDCTNLQANIGDNCNDGNSNTENDVVQANCTCAGIIPAPTVDCPNLNANIGDSCDDNNANTLNDVITENCFCVGTVPTPSVDCPTRNANIGDACNDGNANTTNDVITSNCGCAGTPIPTPPSNGGGCNITYSVTNNVVSIQNVAAPIYFVKILKNDFTSEFECNNWIALCEENFSYTFTEIGNYFIQIQTHESWTTPAICDIYEPIAITSLNGGGGGNNGPTTTTCDNITNGGLITGNEVICPSERLQPFVNSIFPSGGNGTIEYRWLRQEGTCPNSSSAVVPGANSHSFQPDPVLVTTYFRRQSRRVGCTDWENGISNCVVKFIDDDCIVPIQSNNPCGVGFSVSGNRLMVEGLDFPLTSIKVQDARTFEDVFSCDNWSNACQEQTNITLPFGEYFVLIQTFEDWDNQICDIQENISIGSNRTAGTLSNNSNSEPSTLNTLTNKNFDLKVFPNPANQVLNINLEYYIGKDLDVKLMDQLGKTHLTTSIIQNKENILNLPIRNINSGMYLLIVEEKGAQPITKKVIISKD